MVDGLIALVNPEHPLKGEETGEYWGEWGSYVDEQGVSAGVRLMCLADEFRHSSFHLASNLEQEAGDALVVLTDHGLPNADGCPFLPVYSGRLADGRRILQLSGLG